MNTALVLGYFGYENNQLDGQTVKTRNIYSLLKSKEEESFKRVNFFDTQSFKDTKLNLFRMIASVSKVEVIYYLPAQSNLKYIFPFLFIICKILRIQLHYVVVGGWLFKRLKNLPIHRWMLSKINHIYPETETLKNKLVHDYNYTNVTKLHNFRLANINKKPALEIENEKIRLVFMARVHPLKGIETVFSLADELKKRYLKHIIIDVYGPIYEKYKGDFYLKLNDYQKLVNYKGVLEPLHISETLSNYDLMLFPTQFYTEGFPGSILDAYMVHLPVIASGWKYAHEIIDDGKSGIVVEFNNEERFITDTINLIQNRTLLTQFREGAMIKAEQYSEKRAWDILKMNISK